MAGSPQGRMLLVREVPANRFSGSKQEQRGFRQLLKGSLDMLAADRPGVHGVHCSIHLGMFAYGS
jgi:hypothetical protein